MPIFNSEKCFFSQNKTLALRIEKTDLPREYPEKLSIKGIELVLKDIYHISLFPVNEINEKYELSLTEDDIREMLTEFLINNDIEVEFGDEYRYVEGNDRKSVVVMCKSSNISDFYDLVNKKFGLNILPPVPHTTIYTLPGKHGIYLLDQEDLDKKTKVCDLNS
ncbi:MAG: hypothetical protein V4509_00070 [Patescibacteria group bacterium]